MSKVAHYLQEHLTGEVMTGADARRYFATDSSIFALLPAIVVYPQNENDIRKTARFTWQLAERGRIIPMTARGAGTDQSGAALGSGIMMAFPAHMNRIVELDSKTGVVVAEPGLNYGKLQQTLQTHGRFLPPFPASAEYSTIGGAVANNAGGEKSIKYGVTRDYVRSLRVVLANGEVIETYRLGKRELGKKLGLSTFEGEIYRAIDSLLDENKDVLQALNLGVSKNAAGYNLADIKRKDGSFDLTPLFVGSQGTLGIISEITLETEDYNPQTTLLAAYFDNIEDVQTAVGELLDKAGAPSAVELVDRHLLDMVNEINPNQLKGVIEAPFPGAVLLVEYDDRDRHQAKNVKKARKILEHFTTRIDQTADPMEQERLWKIRHASATITGHTPGNKKALPIIDDGVVPLGRFNDYVNGLYELFKRHRLEVAIWGHAANGNLHVQPFLDLAEVGDRQQVFSLMNEYYSLVISLGGTISGELGDGRLRGPFLEKLYGPEVYSVFKKVKQICDPYGTLNPGVKIGVNLDDIRPMMRSQYSLEHLYDHLPRS